MGPAFCYKQIDGCRGLRIAAKQPRLGTIVVASSFSGLRKPPHPCGIRRAVMASIALTLLAVVFPSPAMAQQRIAPPQFVETNHQVPSPQYAQPSRLGLPVETAPAGSSTSTFDLLQWIDLAVLAGALGLSAYLVLVKRRRAWIVALGIACLAYFGFWRQGCVCPVGSVQNVSFALFGGYAMPLVTLGFFALPIVAALFVGRVFCGSACPIGAMQDLLLLRPLRVWAWLDRAGRVGPYAMLAAAVLFAAGGSAFVVCRFDPMVGFWRLSAAPWALAMGLTVLVTSIFIGRPYCRYVCPYGVLLGWASRLAKWRLSVSSSKCVQCRLCETGCPFGALQMPSPQPRPTKPMRWLAAGALTLLPVVAVLLGYGGYAIGPALARVDSVVSLYDQVQLEQQAAALGQSDLTDAFLRSGESVESLSARAGAIVERFRIGGLASGAFVALALGAAVVAPLVRRRRDAYEPHPGRCFSCGRCVERCPVEHARRRGRSPKELRTPQQEAVR